jgi:lysine biosynthesis protein LysW
MPSAVCPACGKNIRVDEDQAYLYERIMCPSCDAELEVVDENPIVLEEVED